nr:hypothetical protein [uncultured Haemophilus sp.]
MKKHIKKFKEVAFELIEMAVVFGGLFLLVAGVLSLAESIK